jgi:hypothetical protein
MISAVKKLKGGSLSSTYYIKSYDQEYISKEIVRDQNREIKLLEQVLSMILPPKEISKVRNILFGFFSLLNFVIDKIFSINYLKIPQQLNRFKKIVLPCTDILLKIITVQQPLVL